MTHTMKTHICIVLLCVTQITAYKAISGMLDSATDLTPEEINEVRPLFEYLQQQYDYIASQTPQGSPDADGDQTIDTQFSALYAITQKEFEEYFDDLLQQHADVNSNDNTDKYNTTLPSVAELLGAPGADLTAEELAERADIEGLLEDALSEAQTQIDEIVQRSLQLEAQLMKNYKQKLVKYVVKALSSLFKIAVRGARAAYCTYSHIPEFNVSLHLMYEGADCYTYSKHLVSRVENETVQTVSTIRKNVLSLSSIYKKIAGKKTLLGKLTVVLLNLSKVVNNIKETYVVGVSALEKMKNELPDATLESVQCGKNFVAGVPQVVDTVGNWSTCIMYVDEATNDYDFLKPESERDFS
ncbi:uncharacterized protein LOC129235878 [Anastrepha obliqua]|uniref:uncharacterized protein LOC129235878 n=1 Tax=Anastrepha obliqua TaxID=95512 RepID=UPI002409FB6E|nr:uncharacterized protein LOC129235878 [Anastrepha obliqua]